VRQKGKIGSLTAFYLLTWIFLSSFISLSVNAQGEKRLHEIDHLSYEEQLVAYRILVNDNPQDSRLQNSLGFCYYRMGNFDKAEKHYIKALMLDPTYSTAYNNLGVIYLKKGEYDLSQQYFDNALKYNPYNVKAMYNMGVTHFRKGDYFKALRCYLKAKKMDEDYVEKRGDKEKVRKEVNEALKKHPGNHILKKVSSHLSE